MPAQEALQALVKLEKKTENGLFSTILYTKRSVLAIWTKPLHMLKKINVNEVKLGMYINGFCGSWLDHPFFKKKFLLQKEKDLISIRRSRVKELWIDISKGLDTAPAHEAGAAEAGEVVAAPSAEQAPEAAGTQSQQERPAPRSPESPTPSGTPAQAQTMEDEVSRAVELCSNAKQAVMSMFHDARMGKAVPVGQAADLVEEISSSVMRHPDALINLARLKNSDDYTYMHSVAVCALMIALARQMQLAEDEVREAGIAGLLHDIGKMAIPNEILDKPGRLSDEEFEIIKSHPVEGHALLVNSAGISERTLDVCLHHHEKINGQGYPHGLSGDKISLFARMGAVCDVYDAVSSQRVYKEPWQPTEALRKMAAWDGHFDRQIFEAFVKSLGIYPVGSLVSLNNGILAVVVEQNREALLTPKVKTVFSTLEKTEVACQLIDLSKEKDCRIQDMEKPQTWGLTNLERFWTGLDGDQLRSG